MGVTYWQQQQGQTDNSIARMDVRYLRKEKLSEAIFYQSHAAATQPPPLEKLKHFLTGQGIEAYFDYLAPESLVALQATPQDAAQRQEWMQLLKAAPFTSIKSLRLVHTDDALRFEGRLSVTQWQRLQSWLEQASIPAERITNHHRTPILRARIPGEYADERSAEAGLEALLSTSGLVTTSGQREAWIANPLRRTTHQVQEWRKQHPAQASGLLYLVGTLGQAFSGLARGNWGEVWAGIFYTLSNLDLGLGPRRSRKEATIVKDALDDFTHNGRVELDKERGFLSGATRLGALPADYLNWREREGNDISSKALLVIAAGYSAFIGALRGKKTLLLDEQGNVKLNAQGRPTYAYVRDPALLYDGTAAMLAYVPQVIFPTPRYDAPPLIDPAAVLKPLADNRLAAGALKTIGDTAPGMALKNGFQYVAEDPARTTGRVMASRNIMHMAIASYDGFAGIPQRIAAYEKKHQSDGFRSLTPHGGDSSLYETLKATFAIDAFVDAEGKLTPEARLAKNRTIEAYEAKTKELSAIEKPVSFMNRLFRAAPSADTAPLKAYLSAHEDAYRKALFLGCFDTEDKTTSEGSLFARHKHYGSYEKLIRHHEARLNDPYHPIERGGVEEQFYIAALNRKFMDELKGSRHMPWLRIFYSGFNYTAAQEMARVNRAEVKDVTQVSQVGRTLDSYVLYQNAAEAVKQHVHQQGDGDKQHDSLLRAVHNMAAKLEGEREIRKAGLKAAEIEAGILSLLQDKPLDRMVAGEQLARQQARSAA